MSIISRIRRVFAPTIYRTYIYGQASAFVDGMDIAELYETQPQLRTVVSFLASNVAQLPLKVFIRESDVSRTRDTTSDLARLLQQPNPSMTTYDLIYGLMSDIKLYDTALWVISEDASSDSGYVIRPIPPTWITGYEGGDLFAPQRVIITNPETGQEIPVDMSDAILWHGYAPEDPRYGTSPVKALRQVLKENIEFWAYRTQQWDRGSRIPAYISRPLEAEGWDDDDMDRFRTAWQDAYANRGHGAGSTPVLEDGMEIKASPSMSMQEAQAAQIITLSMQTVCGIYHVKPGMISENSQTYASARDNARALYTDVLGPDLRMIQERLTRFLVQRLDADPRTYIEFDLNEKLNGSFLDQVQMLQSSVGAPWITRNEARAMVNRPALDGADELIVPLNVSEGGLASPRDTTANSYAATSNEAYTIKTFQVSGESEDLPRTADASGAGGKKADPPRLSSDLRPSSPDLFAGFNRIEIEIDDESHDEIESLLSKFFTRQERSVLSRIGASEKAGKAADPEWYDSERWDRELSDDLYAVMYELVDRYGLEVMRELSEDSSLWSAPRTAAYVRAVADARAHDINQSTLRELLRAMSGDMPEDDEKSTPQGVFDYARDFRAGVLASLIVTSMSSWAASESVRQSGRSSEVWKQWVVTSGNPRDTHAALAGETVPFDGVFSNGARWPGDTGALDVGEVAGCQCRMDLLIP